MLLFCVSSYFTCVTKSNMVHQSFCWTLICLLFLVLGVCGWENVRLSRCLQNRTVNLFVMSHDNCLRYDDFDIELSGYPGVDFPLSVEDLECLIGYEDFLSCASCYLCHYFLHHGQDIFAYKYALRSLEVSPQSSPALSCLAALYLKQGSHVRAAFYSSLSVQYNRTLHIHYNFLGEHEKVYDHIQNNHGAILHPDYSDLLAFLSYSDGEDADVIESHSIFAGLLSELVGSETLYGAYSRHLSPLPTSMVGPSILAYEEFLSHFESLLLWYSDVFLRHTGEPLSTAVGVVGSAVADMDVMQNDVVPELQWPQDKTIVILVQPKFGGHTMTFDENAHGMCDTLARLGVPFRVVTRLIPDDDFISLQNYGVQANEIMDKTMCFGILRKILA